MANADKIGSKTKLCCKGCLRKEKPKQPVRQLRRTVEKREWKKELDNQ